MKISGLIDRLESYCKALEDGIIKNSADDPVFLRSNIDKCKRYMDKNGDVLLEGDIMKEIFK